MKQDYLLGHSNDELERLERQGRYMATMTRGLLMRAGVGPGMRVLDFGAGAGDVSLIASELVGPSGEVVAVDRSADALGRLQMRISTKGINNVSILYGSEEDALILAQDKPFDALVGRLVLLHQVSPERTMLNLFKALRPGGVIAFHEIDIEAGCWSSPECSLMGNVYEWIVKTFTAGGMCTDIRQRMATACSEAGLEDVHIIREGRVESGDNAQAYEHLAQTVRVLMPPMLKMGVATEDQVGIDTLAGRLRDEAVGNASQFIPFFMVGAIGRIPAQ